MLVALLTAWLLGGGLGSSTTVGYVDQLMSYAKITDEAQREAVRETAKELKKAGKEEAAAAAKVASALIKKAGNREATPQDYEPALSQIRDHSIALQDKLVQERFRLKSELTREQWAELHATPATSMVSPRTHNHE